MVKFITKSLQAFRSNVVAFLEETGIIDSTPVADGIWDDSKTWADVVQWIDQES